MKGALRYIVLVILGLIVLSAIIQGLTRAEDFGSISR